ncbi:MAG: LysM peptidoglycan-binding domain-containing protein, partial [Anaerolineae bacterium]|nr:LysM peptidoglycan-binding domain-containing protein [Anaerolineae bacterium]
MMDDELFGSRYDVPIGFPESEPEVPRRTRRLRSRSGLPARQVVFILVANAVISLFISWTMVRCAAPAVPATEHASAAATPPAQHSGDAREASVPVLGSPESSVFTPTAGTVQAQATPTPAGPVLYTVQAGDTLSSIAMRFQVSLKDLMRANGLDNPDYLMLGQQLIIPVGGLPVLTPTFTSPPPSPVAPLPFEPPTPLPPGASPPIIPAATPPPTPTPVPTLTPVPASEIRISITVLNPGDVTKEAVYLVNQGLYVWMSGWTLSDDREATYTFPEFGLGGNGAAVQVHTTVGVDTATDLYWGRTQAAWSPGDSVTLRDPKGRVIAST